MKRLLTMIKNAFKIAKLLSVDDSQDLRFGQVSMLGKEQKVMIFSPYGLMYNPPENSLALIWSQQGQESNGVAMADDPKNRTLKDLKPGEVALGNYLTGNYIKFDKDGLCTIIAEDLNIQITNDITITAENMDAQINSLTSLTTGDLEVNADLSIEMIAGTTFDMTATGAMALVAASIGMTSSGAATLTAPSFSQGGVNIGNTHIHSQGNDSDGDSEVDTGVPHS